MVMCGYCNQEVTCKTTISCSGNSKVSFPDGGELPAVPYAAPPVETREQWFAELLLSTVMMSHNRRP